MYYYHDAAATACYRQVRQLSAQSINFFFCIPTCIYVRHASFYFHPRTLSVSLIINTIIRSTLSYRPDLQVKCSSLHDNTHIRIKLNCEDTIKITICYHLYTEVASCSKQKDLLSVRARARPRQTDGAMQACKARQTSTTDDRSRVISNNNTYAFLYINLTDMCTYKLSYLGASLLVSVYISYMHIHKNIYMGMIDGVSYSDPFILNSIIFFYVSRYRHIWKIW